MVPAKIQGISFLIERMKTRHRSCWEEKPEFFKILLGDFHKRLRIPWAFIKHISQKPSERVILEGPSGNTWEAKVRRTTNHTFLQDGWDKFSNDHSLKVGDFLVFKYDGHMHFSIRIFDRSGCLREDLFTVKSSQESAGFRRKKRYGRPSKGFQTKKRFRQSKSPLDSSHLFQHAEKHHKVDELEPQHLHQSEQLNSIQGRKQKPDRPITITRRNACEAASSFSSNFPFFMMEMKKSHVRAPGSLTIPACFAESYLPRRQEQMKLQNEGKMWQVNFRYYPGRAILCGGWLAFSSENNLRKGDFCVFELVDKLDMKVHVFRLLK